MNNLRRVAAAKEVKEQTAARMGVLNATSSDRQGRSSPHFFEQVQGRGPEMAREKTQDQFSALSHYASCISLSGSLSGSVPRKANAASNVVRDKDKSDRATNQQVLDPRTLVILFKMLQCGFLAQIDGVISTGKEANVYHASMPAQVSDGETDETPFDQRKALEDHVAIKIYKTSILVFKDRHQYVSGEFRFRNGYTGSNPRKMVKTWAEKEARNLKRLVSAGIRAPKPLELRDHVLVMDFLGDDQGWASPRLKDAEKTIDDEDNSTKRWEELYREMLVAMRTMWWRCRLVHADLSEYNVLYHEHHLWIIDVSQSVEHDHPQALDFLRADISHVEAYFSKCGAFRKTLGLRKVFDWILKEPASRTLGGKTGGRAGIDQEMEADVAAAFGPGLGELPELSNKVATAIAEIVQTRGKGPFATLEIRTREVGETEQDLMNELEEMMDAGPMAESSPSNITGTTSEGTAKPQSADDQVREEQIQQDDAVFFFSHIPRTLNEVSDPERDIHEFKQRGPQGLIYAGGVTSLGQAQQDAPEVTQVSLAQPDAELPAPSTVEALERKKNDCMSEAQEESSSESDNVDNVKGGEEEARCDATGTKAPRGHRHEDRQAKKLRKAEVKQAQRERRQSKMSKKDKAKKIKKTRADK